MRLVPRNKVSKKKKSEATDLLRVLYWYHKLLKVLVQFSSGKLLPSPRKVSPRKNVFPRKTAPRKVATQKFTWYNFCNTKSVGDILSKILKHDKIFVLVLSEWIYDSVENAAFPEPQKVYIQKRKVYSLKEITV